MEITKEWVQQRIEALTSRQNQLIAEVNAVAGGLASMNDLLVLLDTPSPSAEAEKDDIPHFVDSHPPLYEDKETQDVLGNLAKSE